MTIAHNCSDEIKEATLKATPARVAAMQLFENHDKPLDAQHLVDHLSKEGIDRVTVFRMLNAFVEKGLLRKLEFGEGKARYELADKEDHHHLICERCGSISDIEDTVVPALEKHIESHHHFKVKSHSLEFFGLCEDCQKKYE